MEYIYFSTVDGDMVDNYDLVRMARIVNGYKMNAENFDDIRCYAKSCKGIVKEINPSVKHLVKDGRKVKAVMVYHRRHTEMSLLDCKKFIDKMEENLRGGKYVDT